MKKISPSTHPNRSCAPYLVGATSRRDLCLHLDLGIRPVVLLVDEIRGDLICLEYLLMVIVVASTSSMK
jgi:hypothetical protein